MSTIVRKPANKSKSWVVRYQQDGKQRERGFSTKTEATAFKTDLDHGQRYGTHVDTKLGKASFGEACETYISRMAVNERTKRGYRQTYAKHIKPVFGARTLASVANDRDTFAEHLCVTMSHLTISPRRTVRALITGTLDDAVAAGKIQGHKLARVDLAPDVSVKYDEFTPATMDQVDVLAGRTGIVAYLMLGCGLRAEEALGVHREHFRMVKGRVVLRVSQQASRDGRAFLPCKKRHSTAEHRDVPVPAWLWDMVKDMPAGPLSPGKKSTYAKYETVRQRFVTVRRHAGLPETFTMHSLRHQYGSVLLRAGVPITDVAGWLGHRDIRTTYAEYRSELDGAHTDAIAVLDALRIA